LNFQDGKNSSQGIRTKPGSKSFSLIVKEIRDALGLGLFGIDVAVDADSGRYGLIS